MVTTNTRRPAMIKKQKKAIKKTRSEQYIMNKKYLGDEPTFTSVQLDDITYTKALYWYNSMCSQEDAKEYLVDYLRAIGRDGEAKRINNVHKNWIPSTAGWQARMWGRGAKLSEASREFFESRVNECLTRDYSKARMEVDGSDNETIEEKPKPSQKPSVQDRMTVLINDFICGVEEEIDAFLTGGFKTSYSLYEAMKAIELPSVQAKRVYDYLDPQLVEIEHAYNKTDKSIAEGYASYSAKQLEALYDFFLDMVEDAERYGQNEKKARKPRTPKPITADKKLKDFKYKPEDVQFKLKSIQPTGILGAGELWVFNVKYNQLTVFRSDTGLDVHRTAITNFDPATSMTKKLKAKDVQSVLTEVLKGGKIVLRKMMDNIKGSDQRLQERMNENTILMRVVPK